MIEENKNCWLLDKCNHVDCDSFCLKRFKLNYLFEEALIPLNRRLPIPLYLDKDGSDKEEFLLLKEFEQDIISFVNKGKNIYIHSIVYGNGKSSWALRLIQSYFNKIWPNCELRCKALFINVPQFLLAIKDNITNNNEYAEHIKENVYNADLVVWDDIGNKAITQFEADNLLAIIDSRMNKGKSNIYTSNLNDVEIHEALGDRLSSRIINSSYNIEFKGADKRGLKISDTKSNNK